MPIRYELLNDLGDIEALSTDWDELLDRSCCNRAFSSPTWFLAACRAQPLLLPCAAVAFREHEVAGVLPLAIDPAGDAIFPSAVSSYNDVIAECTDDEAICGLLKFAISPPKPYRRLRLRWIRQSANLLRSQLCGAYHLDQEYYSFVRLPPSYEAYLESRSKLFRRNTRRARRIAELDGFTIEPLDPASFPADLFLETFLSLHLSRFGDASTFRRHPENLAFARLALPALFVRGQILALALRRGGDIAGMDVCLIGHDSLCAWNGGYLPEIERWSPGRLLTDEGIRLAFQRGLRDYDLLRGAQEWKRSWTNELRYVGHAELALAHDVADSTVA